MSLSQKMKVDVRDDSGTLVVHVGGYLNSSLGEEVEKIVGSKFNDGTRSLLLNFGQTRMVNSIGISFIIGVVEKVMEGRGRMAFCEVNRLNRDLFQVTGLSKYVHLFDTEGEALEFLARSPEGEVREL